MINILFPVNKSVTDIFQYYSVFLNRIREYLGENEIEVTILLFSKNLEQQVTSKTMILGDTSHEKYLSIGDLEHEYEFSFREILYTDLLQTAEFITRTRGRNWYLPDYEFGEKPSYKNKMNQIVELFEKKNFSFVFADQTTDYEFNFIKYVCLKKSIPFIRYIANFMNRGNFIFYQSDVTIKSINVDLNITNNYNSRRETIVDFINNYRNSEAASIYNMQEVNLKQYEPPKKFPLWKRLLNKSFKDYRIFLSTATKEFYINKIEKSLKRFYYDDYDKDMNYIYYGLHLTTESHVALNSFPYLNQISVIEMISRAMPFGFTLYVKLHPWWGNKITLKVLKQIKKIPSVKVIPSDQPIKEIIRHSNGLVTLNATTGIEALVLSKPLIALASINGFTEHHRHAELCTNMYDLPKMINRMVNTEFDDEATIEYLQKKFTYTSDLRLEGDRFLSIEDAEKKARQYSDYLVKIINNCEREEYRA